eukprot:719160-Amphidinium_carterae.1
MVSRGIPTSARGATAIIGQRGLANTDATSSQQCIVERAPAPRECHQWSEGYIWCDIRDAGDLVLGTIRPTRATTKATMASR